MRRIVLALTYVGLTLVLAAGPSGWVRLGIGAGVAIVGCALVIAAVRRS